MRTTRPPAGSFGTVVAMSHTAAACPDLHGDLDNLGVSLTTRYALALQASLVKQSSVEIRKQIKEEARE